MIAAITVFEVAAITLIVLGLLTMVAAVVVLSERHEIEHLEDQGRERLGEIRTSQGRCLSAKESAGAAATARRTTHGG